MSETSITVFLDKKIAGHIKKVEGGFQYFPKGQKQGGEIMSSVFKVKVSLETPED
jgi:hypothetical protein